MMNLNVIIVKKILILLCSQILMFVLKVQKNILQKYNFAIDIYKLEIHLNVMNVFGP